MALSSFIERLTLSERVRYLSCGSTERSRKPGFAGWPSSFGNFGVQIQMWLVERGHGLQCAFVYSCKYY